MDCPGPVISGQPVGGIGHHRDAVHRNRDDRVEYSSVRKLCSGEFDWFSGETPDVDVRRLPWDYPGAAFMGLATVDTFTHSWDLAKATGQSADLDPDLAAQLLEQSKVAISDGVRGPEPMPFGPEQDAGAGACAADQQAAFLGRTVA